MSAHKHNEKPWYQQFWPWFIIALPLSSVIAGIATVIIAMQEPQELVMKSSDEKIGRAIVQKREQKTLYKIESKDGVLNER